MTESELITMMIGGMAHIAGGVLAAYVGMLGGGDPEQQAFYAKHLLAASIMAAPATLVIAKILIPETGEPLTGGKVALHVEKESKNIIDAAAAGASDGMKLAINIAAMLLAFVALLRGGLPDSCDVAPAAMNRRYTRELMLAMGAYVLVLLGSVWLLRHVEAPALRALVALAPLPPIAAALRAIVRYIRDADEMQQRIELEAVCVATALVSLLYMAGGFLQAAKVIDVPAAAAMIWMFPLVCVTYGLAKVVVARRYR